MNGSEESPFTDETRDEGVVQEALGQSEAFLTFQERLSRVAIVDRPVLLIGERGTGKELAAARIHYLSKRWQEPFVALNCAALPPSLIEAELFGHEAGAFTGATRRRSGRFESAQGGTLMLDELGAVPVVVQEKILRVVEYGVFERVGSSDPVQSDARIVGATNADLPAMTESGDFKADLLDRLSFEVLFVPPLRARREDILLLANHFAARMVFELGWTEMVEITPRAAAALEGYAWPGNVRELKNVIERAVYRSEHAVITEKEIVFDPFASPYAPARRAEPAPETATEEMPTAPFASTGPVSFSESVRAFEIDLLRAAMDRARYNQRQAAEELGLTYHQFRGLYRKYQELLQ